MSEPSAPEDSSSATAVSDRDDVAEFNHRLRGLTPRTPVTWAFLAANLAVFTVMVASGVSPIDPGSDALLAWGADYGVRTTNGEWWRLFTSMFVHIGVLHLGMNMWVLSIIGRFLERIVGSIGLLVVYILSGLFGSLASLLWDPFVVSAGASGAVFGLYGALLGFLIRRRHAIPPVALRQLQHSAMYFVAYNLVLGFSILHVDNAAHLGGLFGGLALGCLVAQPISPQGLARRTLAARNAAVVGGLIVIGIAAFVPRVGDLTAEIEEAWRIFNQSNNSYTQLVADNEAGRLSDADFGREIENRILPSLHHIHLRFAGLSRLPTEQRALASKVRQLILAHIDFYALIARAAPTRDATLFDQADQAQQRTKELFREVER